MAKDNEIPNNSGSENSSYEDLPNEDSRGEASSNDSSSGGSGLIWFLAGAAAGAAIALLYAPQEGERTRRLLKRQARKGRDLVADHGRDLMDKGGDLYRKGRDVAEDAADMLEHGRDLAERKLRR